MESRRILIVEDEPAIVATMEAYLQRDGFKTERAFDGVQGLALYRAAKPDLVLLDIMLPGMDGLELLRAIRRDGETPVILTTARSDEIDRLLGLGLGADDYVVKPFSFREVVARVKAVLRRSASPPASEAPLRVGALTLYPDEMRATLEQQGLDLTPTEFRLLLQLARTPGRVYTRAELLEAVMPESDALERTIDSHLRNVRRKLGQHADALLETVRGVGYRLRRTP